MKLQPINRSGIVIGYRHWCAGCNQPHTIYTDPSALRSGRFLAKSGTDAAPTFDGEMALSPPDVDLCHYRITGGNVLFAADCSHHLAGQTVPLPELPGAA